MRPIRLEIKGITAFRDEQTVDFEKDHLDLFAIAGPTGSGKTSILDAMTYALFGYIERVGNQTSQFVSQGQNRMAVTLEFAVDGERYRVTRSTAAKGPTKILFERFDGADWTQAGEGADRVREANAMIVSAIGLTYDDFTRTVLLPQGRFAEFLVGDAKERREILTRLLGLELFERLAKRAGEIRRDAAAVVDATERLLATEYAGVTPDAVAEAERLAKEAATREATLADAGSSVREVADRWADTARMIRDLETCAGDARTMAATAADVAAVLEGVAERTTAAERELAGLTKTLAAAQKDASKAATAREKAEASWGTRLELERLVGRARELADARDTLAELAEELATAAGEVPELEAALASANERVTVATGDAEAALEALAAAKAALDEANHADLVAAVRAGVHVGDECPVCGTAIASLPKAARVVPVAKAQTALAKAESSASSANGSLVAAQRAMHGAESRLEASAKEVARAERAAARAAADEATIAQELREALGGKLPADPGATVEERIERLEGVMEEERVANEHADEMREELTAAQRVADALAAELAGARGRLEALVPTGVLERAAAAAGDGFRVPTVPAIDGHGSPSALSATAAAIGTALASVAEDLDERADVVAQGERVAFDEAAGAIAELLEIRSATLAELVAEVAAARTEAARVCTKTEHAAVQLGEKLAHSQELAETITEQRSRAEVFGQLALELRQDRLIAFVQAEALQLLATAGSDRLRELSSGRYRLEYEDDEFSVVDTWNGEERRSARTLSGGETFLASLALALALSEQAPSLAVTEKARLDSLFLDEGFGTLDPETLEVVVDAIEQLGGDGRMVGVITHVQELAIRLPSRIEVEKSPRGSTLRVVAEGDPVHA
jgi:DNA repair protein SbcC/Rad50